MGVRQNVNKENKVSHTFISLSSLRKEKYFFKKHKNFNVARLETAPFGNRPSALTIKPYAIGLRQNCYMLVTTYCCCWHLCTEIFTNFRYPNIYNINIT